MHNYTAATVEGFVANEPIVRETKTGKSVCTFAVAINHYSDPDSAPKVSYLDVETWQKLAEMCSKNVKKGKRIMVMGGLRQDRWEGKDGRIQSKIILIGREIRFLDSLKTVKES
ncbi:MAG TPA: single-stranded DNA-binding protein [Spirochaetota bacterium]|nr:single-stranded DNA-binding protein [Spirochaetota bacterium]HPJ40151.1 single-stranded DNA-binding protein [Spirochaetota bacterium]